MELIEREQQLTKLAESLDRVKAGQGCLALVSGDAGIGKTSLVERFISEQAGSAHILWGACDALFSPQPLGPFIDIAIQAQSGLIELIRSGADRLSFATEFFVLLQKDPAPTIVVLEDLHWADEATLDVVKFLGRRIQHTQTLLVLTYRDDEVGSNHPLRFLLGDFPATFTVRIPLLPLSPLAVERLAQPATRRFEGLYRVTGGNPFFVTEIIASDTEGLPASVRDAVLARFSRLSPAAKAIVELASLFPGAADTGLIQEILHPDAPALDECVDGGILRARESALTFRHELARQSVEDSLPAGRARDLHRKILVVLLGREANPANLAEIVHHAVRAGDEDAILRYSQPAARQASALGAHREAISLYSHLFHSGRQLDLQTQAELLDGLSFENYLVSRIDEAIRYRRQAIAIWEQLGRGDRVGDDNRWLSRLYWMVGDGKEAQRYVNLAIDILSNTSPGSPPEPELAMAYSTKSQLHMLAWDEELALEWGNRAIAMAEKLEAAEILVHALTNVGSAVLDRDYEQGRAKIERALQIARANGMHDHVSRCYANLSSSCIRTRKYAEGQRWLDDGLAYTTAIDLDLYTVYLSGWKAQMSFELGRWSEAEGEALAALRLMPNRTIPSLPALIALTHLKVRQGDPAVEDLLQQARALAEPTGELQRHGPVAAAQAEHAWWQGNPSQVVDAAAEVFEQALGRRDHWVAGQLAYWLWRADGLEMPLDRLPLPYRLMIQGNWQAAAQAWERFGCPFEQALALMDGDVQAGLEALQIFTRLGANPAVAFLRQALQARGVKNLPVEPEPVRLINAVQLTERELEVLKLIGDGLTNPSVAEKLIISVGTVKAHTGSIYSKLGVNNRVQALIRARELNLL